jgi:NhaP-type Na+/H+ or K+/H+ antiporter
MHALMGITYGIFLALLFPNAIEWFGAPPGFEPASYGLLSWTLTAFAAGVGLSGIRDLTASFALARAHVVDRP